MTSLSRSALLMTALIGIAAAQSKLPPEAHRTFNDPAAYTPDANERFTTSELRDFVTRYFSDRQVMLRLHNLSSPQTRLVQMRAFYDGWLRGLLKADFAKLSQEGKVDYVLLRNRVEYEQKLLEKDAATLRAVTPLLPFLEKASALQEDRQHLEFLKADAAVSAVQQITGQVKAAQTALTSGGLTATRGDAIQAAGILSGLRAGLEDWFGFYNGYDPAFTAAMPGPYAELNKALDDYAAYLRQTVGGLAPGETGGLPNAGGRGGRGGRGGGGGGGGTAPPAANLNRPLVLGEPIIGTPVGRDVLMEELQREMIVYTPEQLIEIGNREYAWTENEMKKASLELGFGDDWRAALEKVKMAYVAPGGQPELVRNLQIQAETFLRQRDLITIPPLAHDSWRMNMMSPQQMRTAPFFLGGQDILVSYPVVGMSDELSAMIMKGNGPHLSHATVFHELIPGHELQGFYSQRYNQHRSLFSTPFYGEGWALYWEMQLWDLGFHATPEDRIGALFWRMHRAARIVFTLNYQMGRWSTQRCVDFLVSNGHERYTAEGEVRGHVQGSAPLYQISYLMGALQLRSLYQDVVTTKKAMTAKQFNDAVVRTGSMPVEMVRALIANLPLTRDYRPQWRFYGVVPDAAPSGPR